ncbi:unnamed protein product [Toxocara canis]|uniref:Uncharacterized protein n=1 Tax=Toxocara canis TaxID=6265 RepID=A0A183VDS3_TOXCA|nr:unnamed protein product [Toxocara canis]
MCDAGQSLQLRSSLRKSLGSEQKANREQDIDKHVRFACSKDAASEQHSQFPSTNILLNDENERKRTTESDGSACEHSRRAKKNKPNERIIRLSQALETLLRNSKLREIGPALESCREDAELLLDRALTFTEIALDNDIRKHQLEVMMDNGAEQRAVVDMQRQKQIERVKAACDSANEVVFLKTLRVFLFRWKLLCAMESCVSKLKANVEREENGECGDETSLLSEIDALMFDADICRQLSDKMANFHI